MVTTRSKRSLLTEPPAESTVTEAAQALSIEANVTTSPSKGESNESPDERVSPPCSTMKNMILGQLWLEIDDAISKNGGSTHGIVTKIINEQKKQFPWLTRNMLYYYRAKATEQKKLPPQEISTSVREGTQISDLSGTLHLFEDNAELCSNYPDKESSLILTVQDNNNARKKGGRPKGSTQAASENTKKRKLAALNHAAIEFQKQKQNRGGSVRVKKGVYEMIIKETLTLFDLPEDSISKETVRSRLRAGRNVMVAHPGPNSPMIAIESYLVDMLTTLAAMRQPVTPAVALEMINSVIHGTVTESEVREWKKKVLKDEDDDESSGNIVGQKYWRNFLARNPILKTKKCVRFDSLREDWCTLENFEAMYEDVYSRMVECGAALKLPDAVWVNKEGAIVQTKDEAWGRQTNYLLTRPDYVIFVDEVGDNTSQKNDGNVGGTKYVVEKSSRALITSSYKDRHFTALGFTLADGRPLLCVIIIAGAEVDAKVRMGLQPWCNVEGDLMENLEENSNGLEKYFPFGPTCSVNGKDIPCYVTTTENGSITSEILVKVLEHIDSFNVFDRTEAYPFLLLDGHGSRFAEEFLTYVNTPVHKWFVCIGVPYSTNLWQVADSSEQNGMFKSELKKAKQFVIKKKGELHLPMHVEMHDIVGIVHRAFLNSFANRTNNMKAIADRGWNPLTYALLDHKELVKERNRQAILSSATNCLLTGKEPINAESLNLTQGISKTMLDKIVDHEIRERARNTALTTNREQIRQEKVTRFENATRMTAGICFNGNGCLLNDEVLNRVRGINQSKRDKEQATAARKEKSERELKEKVERVRAKPGRESWTVDDWKTMVIWFKRPGDSKIPTSKVKLIERYEFTCNRCENERNRLKQGENAVVDAVLDPPRQEVNAALPNLDPAHKEVDPPMEEV
jgi:hypothetical protein